MTMIPPIVAVASHLTEESIAVNLDGRRFHDEAGPYYDRVYVVKKQRDKKGHYVFGHKTYESKTKYLNQMAGELVKADSQRELAEKLGVPYTPLEESIKQWNDFLASGESKDPVTGRVQFAPERRPISVAPFYSQPMSVGVSLTCGGFVTTKSMQVIDIWGKAIPKLFAVGDVAGGLTPTGEICGTHLGGGFVLGWVAGRLAATGQLEKSHLPMGTFGQQLPKNRNVDLTMPIISFEGWQQKQ
jgi:fumarate reductase flavoprotein subunit